jgi:hypothetical protein
MHAKVSTSLCALQNAYCCFLFFSPVIFKKKGNGSYLCKALRVRTYHILSQSQLTHRALIIVNPAHLGFTAALIVLNPTSQGPYSNEPCSLRLYLTQKISTSSCKLRHHYNCHQNP